MANLHRGRMDDPDIPAEAKDPSTWPTFMQQEWADPVAAADAHRAAMRVGLSRVRRALDDFNPDFVLIWGVTRLAALGRYVDLYITAKTGRSSIFSKAAARSRYWAAE